MSGLVSFCLKNRFLVLIGAVLAIAIGSYSALMLPIDAVPDITPNQVIVYTTSPSLSPLELEQLVTFPVETAMSGLPGVKEIRSISRFGLSYVTIFFDENKDIYFCRQLVQERLAQARQEIPSEFGSPQMGPISTGLGEILQFEVKGQGYSQMELRSILDWNIAFQLRSVPGIVEVNTQGGELKTYEVDLDADRLKAFNISLETVFRALEQNNYNAGGGYIEHNQQQYIVRGEGLLATLDDIGNIVLGATPTGTPIYVKNVANVRFAPKLRQGATTRDGKGEAVVGIAMMLIGGNSRVVSQNVQHKLDEIQKTLPKGVTIDTYYNRTDLVNRTIETVRKNLFEGAVLVIVFLLLMLGNWRAALIVASVIPLSMLLAFTGMVATKTSGNLMSLGAIDFGLIVDGSVVMIENIVRHLAENKQRKDYGTIEAVRDSAQEVARPVFFAVLIIMVVYVPILTLEGAEGKTFRPMAITVIFALVASLLFALTYVPVMASLLFKNGVSEHEPRIVTWIKNKYQPWLEKALAYPGRIAAGAGVLLAISIVILMNLGSEFIPRLDEGALVIQSQRLPSGSLSESIASTTLTEKVLKRFPEVVTVVSRTGRPEVATDPMGIESSDIYVILKPHKEWTTTKNRDELIKKIDAALEKEVPGNLFSYSQPIEMRTRELASGVRSDLAITLYGDDLDLLKQKADEIVDVVGKIPGAADVRADQTSGLPYLRVIVRRDQIARYGINARDVLGAVEAIGGKEMGQVLENQRRFALQVRFAPEDRDKLNKIGDLKVASSSGALIPLSQLTEIKTEDGPSQISRSNIHRRIQIAANVRGRDLGGFVKDVQEAVGKNVQLPSGYYVEWGGEFQNLQDATKRLSIAVPISLLLIFVLLYTTFSEVRATLLIFINVPIAASGGIIALALRGMPFSISAGVGFIAVSGIAVLNGVVLVSYLQRLREQGESAEEAVRDAALTRLRPVLTTALVASFGFIPMALATSAGAEVQRPLATVVIGGLITSTALTLFVLPSFYRWDEQRRQKKQALEVPAS
jgi:cobalt-zinc-cadmium resistance protein CzcA